MKRLNRRHTAWLFSIGFCLFMSLSIPATAQDIKINRSGVDSDITPPECDSTQPAVDKTAPAAKNINASPVVKKEPVKDFAITTEQWEKH